LFNFAGNFGIKLLGDWARGLVILRVGILAQGLSQYWLVARRLLLYTRPHWHHCSVYFYRSRLSVRSIFCITFSHV